MRRMLKVCAFLLRVFARRCSSLLLIMLITTFWFEESVTLLARSWWSWFTTTFLQLAFASTLLRLLIVWRTFILRGFQEVVIFWVWRASTWLPRVLDFLWVFRILSVWIVFLIFDKPITHFRWYIHNMIMLGSLADRHILRLVLRFPTPLFGWKVWPPRTTAILRLMTLFSTTNIIKRLLSLPGLHLITTAVTRVFELSFAALRNSTVLTLCIILWL